MKKPLGTMKDGWDYFEHQAIPSDAGPIQRKATRQAFYAGALYLMDMLMKNVDMVREKQGTDEEMINHLNVLQSELLSEFDLHDDDRSNIH